MMLVVILGAFSQNVVRVYMIINHNSLNNSVKVVELNTNSFAIKYKSHYHFNAKVSESMLPIHRIVGNEKKMK